MLGIKNRLARIGLDFMPYYWVEEETTPCPEILPRESPEAFSIVGILEN